MNLEKIADKLKVALGRKLSTEQMTNARIKSGPDYRYIPVRGVRGSRATKPIDLLEKLSSGEFVRYTQGFKLLETPDASLGWSHSHIDYVPFGSVKKTYDRNGLLTGKVVRRGPLTYSYDKTTKAYSPPGRFIGRKVKQEKSKGEK